MQAAARAQPNIALIKYWGKRDAALNLPAVGSISITLDALVTDVDIAFDEAFADDELGVNGEPREDLLPRMAGCLDSVAGPGRPRARIVSTSNFPIGAGLASSASAFAAATVAAAAAAGADLTTAALARLAGRASGSAARSLYGGFVELANAGDGIVVESMLTAADWPLEVIVAITDSSPKPVSSGDAMERSRRTSPFYSRWVDDQAHDLDVARTAIAARDFEALADVAEHNCLKMHSVMWTSRPSIVYWNAATLDCLAAVRTLRGKGTGVFFTVDAGPQVKAVCLPEDATRVRDAFESIDGVAETLRSGLGPGARLRDPE